MILGRLLPAVLALSLAAPVVDAQTATPAPAQPEAANPIDPASGCPAKSSQLRTEQKPLRSFLVCPAKSLYSLLYTL